MGGKRQIHRSKECFESKNLVRLLVNVIICALDATFAPRSYLDFEYGKQIEVAAIQATQKSYVWGILKTTMNCAFKRKQGDVEPDLFLVDCLGSGSTSVVYRALTMNGYDCVVKIFVEARTAVGESNEYIPKGELTAQFQQRSKEKVEREVKAYKKIYDSELDGYVWMQTLNNLDCVVMPFFRPIPKHNQHQVLSEVQERLKQFQKVKMVFTDCDQLWRHVGSFNNKIFLFDLGDLQTIDDEGEVEEKIKNHYFRLQEKAKSSDTSTAETPPRDS
jgi:Family of unknown function (DUF5898)